jgi:hypothetical protein
MRTVILIAGLAAGLASTANAQAPFVYKPIDANKLIVKPGDTVSGVAANASTSTFRTITRSVASAVESNGFVKTINNLLGRRAQPEPTVQNGFSPLPTASTYQSSRYPNSFTPAMPQQQAYGKSPPTMTTTPVINR